jgi:thymidylate kinase
MSFLFFFETHKILQDISASKFQIIYLRTNPEVAFERILNRKRSEENNISFQYIKGKIWIKTAKTCFI